METSQPTSDNDGQTSTQSDQASQERMIADLERAVDMELSTVGLFFLDLGLILLMYNAASDLKNFYTVDQTTPLLMINLGIIFCSSELVHIAKNFITNKEF